MPFTNLFGLMGIATAPNGDIWVADGSDDQLLLFPGGRLKEETSGLKTKCRQPDSRLATQVRCREPRHEIAMTEMGAEPNCRI